MINSLDFDSNALFFRNCGIDVYLFFFFAPEIRNDTLPILSFLSSSGNVVGKKENNPEFVFVKYFQFF